MTYTDLNFQVIYYASFIEYWILNIADITHCTKFGWVHSGNDIVKDT